MKKFGRIAITVYVIFVIVSIVSIMSGIFAIFSFRKFMEDAVEISATISEIESYKDSDGDTSYRVYIDYSYDGEEYSDVAINFYSFDMYEGKEMTMYLNPLNPSQIQSSNSMIFIPLIFIGLGIVFLLLGSLPLIKIIMKNISKKKLIEKGNCIYGVVDRVAYNTSYSVNGQHPFVVYCNYRDEYKDVLYKFKSDNLWIDADELIRPDDSIRIYVNGDDYSKYYVDVDSILQKSKIIDYT